MYKLPWWEKKAEVKSRLTTATALVIADFEAKGVTVATKPGKLVMLTNQWADRMDFLRKFKAKVAQACGQGRAAKMAGECFTRSARYLGADLAFSGRRSVAVQKTRLREA